MITAGVGYQKGGIEKSIGMNWSEGELGDRYGETIVERVGSGGDKKSSATAQTAMRLARVEKAAGSCVTVSMG